MLPSIPPSAPFIPHKYKNTFYIDSVNGSDTNDGSYENPFRTLTKANSVTTGAGTLWVIGPGTYTDAVNISMPNIDIVGFGAKSGLVNISGTLTFSGATGSVRCANLAHASLVISSSGSNYFQNCNMSSGTVSKTGIGFLSVETCDWGIATATNFSAGSALLTNTYVKKLTISGTSRTQLVSCSSCIDISVTGGFLDIANSVVIASTSGGYGFSTSGTGGISLKETRILDSDGNLAPIFSTGSSLALMGCTYKILGSQITSPLIGGPYTYHSIRMLAPNSFVASDKTIYPVGLDYSGNLVANLTSSTAPIEARYTKNTVQSLNEGGQTIITFADRDYDTHSAFNGTLFTCPRDGYLTMTSCLRVTNSSVENSIMFGKNQTPLNTATYGGTNSANGHVAIMNTTRVKVAYGDRFDVRLYSGVVNPTVVGSGTNSANSVVAGAPGQCWVTFSLT